MSVCQRNPSASQNWSYRPLSLSTIEPIDHWAYQPSSLSTIEPINHRAYQPLSLLTIKPIDHQAFWPSSLSTIKPIDCGVDCYEKSNCPDLEWWKSFKYVPCLLCKISQANSQYSATERPSNIWPILNLSQSFYPIIISIYIHIRQSYDIIQSYSTKLYWIYVHWYHFWTNFYPSRCRGGTW